MDGFDYVKTHGNGFVVDCDGMGADDVRRMQTINNELVRAFAAFNAPQAQGKQRCTIYGSARTKWYDREFKFATALGFLLGRRGWDGITGGGPGIMEAGNKGFQLGGANSYGLNIWLPHEQSGNEYQTHGLDFRYFLTRKFIFVKYSDAFVLMPGGYGTLDEFYETITLIQCERSKPAPMYLVDQEFWMPIADGIQRSLLGRRYISGRDMNLFTVVDYDVHRLVDMIIRDSQGVEKPAALDRQKLLAATACLRRRGQKRPRADRGGKVRCIVDPEASYSMYGSRVRTLELPGVA